ncbi:MAG: 4-hydroxy-tetrahydrodipicolinate synthase [Sphaerochaetaceae bacterium]|nr:4-hydroxy-tetrahydrodipicolinate synthase [Sphaerochaetaceae bacterium]
MIKGVCTALVTPFNEDGSVDYESYEKLVRNQIENNIDALVPLGTTAENPTLEPEEKRKLIRLTVELASGKIPVIAGCGSNSTYHAIEATKEAKDLGASMSLQVCPYYNKPTPSGLYRHFISIAEAVDLDMMIYNIPGRTGTNIPNNIIWDLAKHPRIIALKEASGNIHQLLSLLNERPEDFSVLSGDDFLTLPLITCGGQGVVSVASNVFPSQIAGMVHLLLDGNIQEGSALFFSLFPFFENFFLETNPIPIKTYMASKGLLKEFFRLPLTPMKTETKEQLLCTTMKQFNIN